MKLHTTDPGQSVITNNHGQTATANIVASSKAFSILSSNIYSNKLRAVIREISTNAVDAHIEAGNKNPFRVVLPSVLNPTLEIRDFGVGLSPEDVMGLHQTYFMSTKAESYDLVGQLGLGSKSPYSYTSTFTIISYFNGTAYHFAAYIDGGMPTTKLIHQHETDEHNGLCIQIPIKPADINKAIKEAKYVYSTFNMIYPEFENVEDDFQIDYIDFEGKSFIYKRDIIDSVETGVFFVMGGVRYPLNQGSFEITADHGIVKSLKDVNNFSTSALYINAPIGSLDIEPGREGLSYDELTIENIDKLLKSVNYDFVKVYDEELDLAVNGRDAYKIYNSIPNVILPRSIFTKVRTLVNGLVTSYDNIIRTYDFTKSEFLSKGRSSPDLVGIENNEGWENSDFEQAIPLFAGSEKRMMSRPSILNHKAKLLVIECEHHLTISRANRLKLIKAVRNKLKSEDQPIDYTVIAVSNSSNRDPEETSLLKRFKEILEHDYEEYKLVGPEVDEIIKNFYSDEKDSNKVSRRWSKSSGSTQRAALIISKYSMNPSDKYFTRDTCYDMDLSTRESIEELIKLNKEPNTYFIGHYYHTHIPVNNWENRLEIRSRIDDFDVNQHELHDLGYKFMAEQGSTNNFTLVQISSKLMASVGKAQANGLLPKLRCYYKDFVGPLAQTFLRAFPEGHKLVELNELNGVQRAIETCELIVKKIKDGEKLDSYMYNLPVSNWFYSNYYKFIADYVDIDDQRQVHEYALVGHLHSNEIKDISYKLLNKFWKFTSKRSYDILDDIEQIQNDSRHYATIKRVYTDTIEKIFKAMKIGTVEQVDLDVAMNHYNSYDIAVGRKAETDSVFRVVAKDVEDYMDLLIVKQYFDNALDLDSSKTDMGKLEEAIDSRLNKLIKKYGDL